MLTVPGRSIVPIAGRRAIAIEQAESGATTLVCIGMGEVSLQTAIAYGTAVGGNEGAELGSETATAERGKGIVAVATGIISLCGSRQRGTDLIPLAGIIRCITCGIDSNASKEADDHDISKSKG
jgi:hypothetical protein